MCRQRSLLLAISSLSFALVKVFWVTTAATTAAVHLHASHETTTSRHLLRKGGREVKGIKFDFSGEAGGGKGFLRRMQRRNPTKVNRIMRTSDKTKNIDDIGRLLDMDRDLVGCACVYMSLAAALLLLACILRTMWELTGPAVARLLSRVPTVIK
jgi:hypothetical protein